MQDIKAVIFDKDGTLFGFQATWAPVMLRLLKHVAPDGQRDAAAAAIGVDPTTGGFRPESVVIAGTTQDVADALAPVTGLAHAEIVRIANEIGASARQVPAVDLVPCLSGLAGQYRLGLVTNDSEAPARAHLESVGIAGFFEFIAGYDSGFGAKPEPGQLHAFCEVTGLAPDAVVMVGDSTHDLEAGRAAGMATVGVLTGIAGSDVLAPLADVVLPDIGHLARWLDEQGLG